MPIEISWKRLRVEQLLWCLWRKTVVICTTARPDNYLEQGERSLPSWKSTQPMANPLVSSFVKVVTSHFVHWLVQSAPAVGSQSRTNWFRRPESGWSSQKERPTPTKKLNFHLAYEAESFLSARTCSCWLDQSNMFGANRQNIWCARECLQFLRNRCLEALGSKHQLGAR